MIMPERALDAFWLACVEDGGMDGAALKAAMLKFSQQERKPMTYEQIDEIRLAVGYAAGMPRFIEIVNAVEAHHGIVPAPEDKPALVCQEQQLEDEDPWLSGDDMMGDN